MLASGEAAEDELLSPLTLGARIDALQSGWAGHQSAVLLRNQTYLRWYSPEFSERLREHDQWSEPLRGKDINHNRSSFNIARPTADVWAALEAAELPAVRWQPAFIATPAPSLDEQENERRQETFRAMRLVAQQVTTMREQALDRHIRLARFDRAFYRVTQRKNVYGHAWMKVVPRIEGRRFFVQSKIDSATVYPVWSGWEDERELDAILVVTKVGAAKAHQLFGSAVPLDRTGLGLTLGGLYQPTVYPRSTADLSFVWVEDYWLVDRTFTLVVEDGPPVTSRVIHALRVNGTFVQVDEFKGWPRVPFFPTFNDDLRGHLGASDIGTAIPFQDGLNRMLSEQADVIHGESRPKFLHRSEGAQGTVTIGDEGIIDLDIDENLEQLAVALNVFPTQVHGQQLTQLFGRATGLSPVVWGEISAAQNSGRALSTAWQATAARLVPRVFDSSDLLEEVYGFMLDLMELYDWDNARDLYAGNRDFALDWPNKEPRDFLEVTTDAINRYNVGGIDLQAFMEATNIQSPDEMIERVRAEYMDAVLHPDKAQGFMLLQRLKQQIEAEAQQQALSAAQAAAALSQPAGGAPGSTSLAAQQGQIDQARTQAAQQAQPVAPPGTPQPATGPGAAAPGQARSTFGTLVQDGHTMNRIINQGPL